MTVPNAMNKTSVINSISTIITDMLKIIRVMPTAAPMSKQLERREECIYLPETKPPIKGGTTINNAKHKNFMISVEEKSSNCTSSAQSSKLATVAVAIP